MLSGFGSVLPTMVLVIAGMVAFAAMTVVTWWALFGDRGKARRCPSCWHDLSGTPGLVCGECGLRALDESQLHRPRRRWRVALVTLLIMLSSAAVLRWYSTGSELIDFVPDRALILMMPWSDGSDQIAREVSMRLSQWTARGFDASERDAVFARCLAGDDSAPPGSVAWERRYGPILEPWLRTSAGFTGQQLAALRDLPCRITVQGPRPWPVDAPTRVHLRLDRWWPAGSECRVAVRPRDGSGTEVVAIRTDNSRSGVLPIPVAGLPADTKTLDIEVDVERRRVSPLGWPEPSAEAAVEEATEWEPLGQVVLTLSLGERLSEPTALEPVDDSELHALMQSAFSGRFMRSAAGVRRFGVLFDPRITALESLRDVAVGLRIEVLEGGVPRRISHLWWMGGPIGDASLGAHAWEIVHEDAAALDRAVVGDPAWTLRITGEREIAARALSFRYGAASDRLKYFSGSFEMPLRLEHNPGTAQPRPWQVESGADGQ